MTSGISTKTTFKSTYPILKSSTPIPLKLTSPLTIMPTLKAIIRANEYSGPSQTIAGNISTTNQSFSLPPTLQTITKTQTNQPYLPFSKPQLNPFPVLSQLSPQNNPKQPYQDPYQTPQRQQHPLPYNPSYLPPNSILPPHSQPLKPH